MEKKLDQLIETLVEVKGKIDLLANKVETLETRLNGLGKVDSIEHRVTSNQIDITDIKEALERMEEIQSEKVETMLKEVVQSFSQKSSREISTIHKRLDSHLLKLGRVEEDILMLKEEKS